MSCFRCRNGRLGLVFPSGRGLFHNTYNISHGIHPRSIIQTLNRPKNRSGANLVCPTNMNESSTVSLRPMIALHTKYCMTMLFCSGQRNYQHAVVDFFSFRPWFCKKMVNKAYCGISSFPTYASLASSNLLVLMLAHKICKIY